MTDHTDSNPIKFRNQKYFNPSGSKNLHPEIAIEVRDTELISEMAVWALNGIEPLSFDKIKVRDHMFGEFRDSKPLSELSL